MTVNSTTNRVAYTGNGTANPLAVAFPFQKTTDLKVVRTLISTGAQTTLALNTDYTVTGTPDANGFYSSGGSVVPVSSIASTYVWTIIRNPPLTQLVQHTDNDPVPASSLDSPPDKLTMIAQRLQDQIDRAFVAPDGDAAPNLVLPAAVTRALKVLSFDASGNATTSDPSVDAAIAAAAAAAVSASSAASYAALISAAVGLYSTPVTSIVNTPTGAEASGARYIVGTSPIGAFIGKAKYIAQLNGTTWVFAPPIGGLVLQGANLGAFYSYMNNTWRFGLSVGGDTSAISAEVFPVLDVVQDNVVSTGFASCISQFGATGAPTFHTHKFRGTPSAPTKALNGDFLVSWGLRACRETGSVGGSPAALFVTLLEDSNLTDYPGVTWNFRGTSTGTGAPTNWISFYQGRLGVNDATPATMISAQNNQNSSTSVAVRNTNNGASAQSQMFADNGTYKLQAIMYGTGFTGSGVNGPNMASLTTDGTGGLSIYTGASAPIVFGIANAVAWNMSTGGHWVPSANNVRDIGTGAVAVRNIYSVNALNVTSDAATKEDVRDLTEQEIAAGNAIRWRMFKHVGGDRLHAGVTAQEVEEAFSKQGLDPYAYGVLGKEALVEDVEEIETGEEDVHVMTTITHRKEVVEIVDGVAVVSFVEVPEEVPAMDAFPAYAPDGTAILEVDGRQRMVPIPRMEKKPYSRKVVRKDVPVLDEKGAPVERRFVRYTELKVFCLAAHEARLDALEAAK